MKDDRKRGSNARLVPELHVHSRHQQHAAIRNVRLAVPEYQARPPSTRDHLPFGGLYKGHFAVSDHFFGGFFSDHIFVSPISPAVNSLFYFDK